MEFDDSVDVEKLPSPIVHTFSHKRRKFGKLIGAL